MTKYQSYQPQPFWTTTPAINQGSWQTVGANTNQLQYVPSHSSTYSLASFVNA